MSSAVLVGDKMVTLQVWDTAGQERFTQINRGFYRGCDCVVLVFDINEETTFENLGNWKQEYLNNVQYQQGQNLDNFIVIGNKSDIAIKGQAVESDILQKWCRENGIKKYFVTSAKDDVNVEDAFLFMAKVAIHSETLEDGYFIFLLNS